MHYSTPGLFCWSFFATTRRPKTALSKLHAGLGNPDFNLVLNTVARGGVGKRYFIRHLQIPPRLSTFAGFEIAGGMSINTVLPEEGARYLRGVNPR